MQEAIRQVIANAFTVGLRVSGKYARFKEGRESNFFTKVRGAAISAMG